jgi:hypothetical protein
LKQKLNMQPTHQLHLQCEEFHEMLQIHLPKPKINFHNLEIEKINIANELTPICKLLS